MISVTKLLRVDTDAATVEAAMQLLQQVLPQLNRHEEGTQTDPKPATDEPAAMVLLDTTLSDYPPARLGNTAGLEADAHSVRELPQACSGCPAGATALQQTSASALNGISEPSTCRHQVGQALCDAPASPGAHAARCGSLDPDCTHALAPLSPPGWSIPPRKQVTCRQQRPALATADGKHGGGDLIDHHPAVEAFLRSLGVHLRCARPECNAALGMVPSAVLLRGRPQALAKNVKRWVASSVSLKTLLNAGPGCCFSCPSSCQRFGSGQNAAW